MSMSTYIHGIADAAKLQRAVEARKTLNELGLEYPDELDDIIEDSIAIPYTKVPDEYNDVWEIDVKDIPKNVTKIRFINSY